MAKYRAKPQEVEINKFEVGMEDGWTFVSYASGLGDLLSEWKGVKEAGKAEYFLVPFIKCSGTTFYVRSSDYVVEYEDGLKKLMCEEELEKYFEPIKEVKRCCGNCAKRFCCHINSQTGMDCRANNYASFKMR